MGRQQRTKQADPAPLAGSSAHPESGAYVGKKKAALAARPAKDGANGRSSSKPNGRAQSGVNSGRNSTGVAPPKKGAKAKPKKGKQVKRSAQEMEDGSDSDDDLADLKAEDSFEESEGEGEDAGLEAARSALFDTVDLAPPSEEDSEEELEDGDEFDLDRASDDSDDEEVDDEFDLGDEEGEGVILEDFEMTAAEAEQMPASGKKANKRAARLQYNSDDDTPAPAAKAKIQTKPAKQAAKPVVVASGAEHLEEDDGMDDDEEDDLEGETEDDEDADSDDEIEEGQLTDLRAVERRMRTSARVLANWKQLGATSGKSRSDLVAQLIGDVCQYHGYTPYLAEKLFDLFGVDEALQFFTTSDTPRPLTLRVNTLKTRRRDLAQALINRGVNLEPLEGGWSKVGLQVFSGGGVPVGATPEYLAGHYILQSASSFLPVIALGPQPHERVLDMSAAPGGKTTYMSALMGNTGEVWANDSSRGRIKGLGGNIARLGCRNVIITNVDGREFPKIIGGFDRVLLDAPCSGTGVISKDQSVKVNKSERDFVLLSHLQKQLVLSAIDSVTPNSATGGFVVYSTCSVTTEENEAVVSYALRKRPHVKLVETGLAFGKEGFKSFRGKEFGKNMHLTRRFYPHVHNMDGFFVAKFKVGKPEKKAAVDESLPEEYRPLTEDDDEASEAAPDASAFDDAEDADLIAESKKKYLKAKGVNLKAKGKPAAKKAKTS